MNELHIENLTVQYGRRPVLNHLHLHAVSGEIVGILGENGSGKTTLLRSVQGSIRPKEGSVTVNGSDIFSLSIRRRAALVTTVPQDHPASEGISGMDRIEMGFYPVKGVFGSLGARERQRILDTARELGVLSLLERTLDSMSTGERQLISLLRAAVQDTPVLLLDEPTSALDFTRTGQLYERMHRLAEQGKILLLVTHDPTAALRYCHRIVRMERDERGSCAVELPDLRSGNLQEAELHLKKLYPCLRIHPDPLFCYTET